MARDAIARQYDVNRNQVTLTCETEKGSYRPGVITFYPKQGKTLDLRKMQDSITATRLSGNTSMSVEFLEITATGTAVLDGATVVFQVSGSPQKFVLKEAPSKDGAPTPLRRLREALSGGAKVVSVTGRVDGWNGRFPVVLRALNEQPPETPTGLTVLEFETSKK